MICEHRRLLCQPLGPVNTSLWCLCVQHKQALVVKRGAKENYLHRDISQICYTTDYTDHKDVVCDITTGFTRQLNSEISICVARLTTDQLVWLDWTREWCNRVRVRSVLQRHIPQGGKLYANDAPVIPGKQGACWVKQLRDSWFNSHRGPDNRVQQMAKRRGQRKCSRDNGF